MRALSLARQPAVPAGPRPISAVKPGAPVRLTNCTGDTWVAAWADDGNLYTPSNDTSGFDKACQSNLAFNRLEGNDPQHLTGTTVNAMSDYGKWTELGPDGCSWKSSGCIWIDGALYWVVARHLYGEDSADPLRRQTAQNASIIRSTDYGKTWTRAVSENYQHPMFPGRRFATPYFIDYGRDSSGVDGSHDYVYATSNNGFWDCGDDVVLGRVARAKLALLNGKDWEYYTGGDGMTADAWSPQMSKATRLLERRASFGMTGSVYLAARKRYMMIAWRYPAGGGKMPGAGTHSTWDFYQSLHPWGPWTQIGSYDTSPAGWYSPGICPKFQSTDRVYVFAAGYWESEADYRLTVVPMELD